jgi:alpha-ketoglutarate-dependent taurine dioxygenase
MSHSSPQIAPFTPPQARSFPAGLFPAAYACQEPAAELASCLGWISRRRDELLTEAATHGVVLFRGFPIVADRDFDAFVAAFDLPNFPYEESLSNAVRINRTPRVFTANEAPPSVKIYLHHEMAQTPIYPSRLLFFCEQPAETGGATPVCRSDELWNLLLAEEPDFARDCRAKGVRYTNVMPAANDAGSGMGRSWQSTLRAESRAAAELRLAQLGYSWTWQADDRLRVTTPVLPALRDLPAGRTVFFNQILAAAQGWKDDRNDPTRAVRFGDESPLPFSAVQHAQALAESLTYDLAWQKYDLALVDNFVAMHGRRTFTGTRKVLASLLAERP